MKLSIRFFSSYHRKSIIVQEFAGDCEIKNAEKYSFENGKIWQTAKAQ